MTLLGETFEVDVKDIVVCMILNSDDAKNACNVGSQGGKGESGGVQEDSEIDREDVGENLVARDI